MTTVHPRHTWPTCPGAQCPTTQTWFASVTFSPTVTSWCELPVSCADVGVSTRESHGAATSSSVSCHRLHTVPSVPQVQTGPTRTVTSDLLSATLAEAATQLSFAAFLERASLYVLSRRPRYPTPHHLWMPPRRLFHTSLSLRTFLRRRLISLSPRYLLTFSFHMCPHRMILAALQTIPHSTLSHDVCYARWVLDPAPRYSVDVFVQTAYVQRTVSTRYFHTTTDHGVLYWMYLLERSF